MSLTLQQRLLAVRNRLLDRGDYDPKGADVVDATTVGEAMAEIDRLTAATQWRTMESAPRDGVEILGWREDCGMLMVRYGSADDYLTEGELLCWSEEDALKKDWWGADFGCGNCRLEGDLAPTQWCLPAAPK